MRSEFHPQVEVRPCWRCYAIAALSLEASYERSFTTDGYEFTVEYLIYVCPNCFAPTIARTDIDDPTAPVSWIVAGDQEVDLDHVPAPIARAAEEAYTCFRAGAYRAAILFARTVLEATCKAKGFKDGSLHEMLRGLHNDRMINDLVYEEANELRFAGNDAAHGDFFEELFEAGNDTADDAKEFQSSSVSCTRSLAKCSSVPPA